jgi:hypothetical protein
MPNNSKILRFRGDLRLNFETDPTEPGYVTLDTVPLANRMRQLLQTTGEEPTHLDLGPAEVTIRLSPPQGDLPGQQFFWPLESDEGVLDGPVHPV